MMMHADCGHPQGLQQSALLSECLCKWVWKSEEMEKKKEKRNIGRRTLKLPIRNFVTLHSEALLSARTAVLPLF
jgi:hypothetical protein